MMNALTINIKPTGYKLVVVLPYVANFFQTLSPSSSVIVNLRSCLFSFDEILTF